MDCTEGERREMNRERLLLVALLCVLAIACEWMACKYMPSQTVIPNRSQPATTSEVILNGEIDQPYPADNWWNLDVSNAPVDSNSDAFISWIGESRTLHPDWGMYYGIPMVTVGTATPCIPIDIYGYPGESDPREYYPGPFPYPIPGIATYDWRYVEQGSDHHLIMYNVYTGYLYELFGAEWTGTEWRAKSGAIFDTKVNYRRPEGWTSADAAGLEIMPGLVKYHEVDGDKEIEHAFRFTLRATNGYVWPASHSAGSVQGSLPMGARLRLRANFDVSGYADPVQRFLRALKTRGLILADNGSDMYIQGTQDARWGDMSMWVDALNDVTASDFEVIELGWKPEIGTGIPE